jgi:hypothetical protein
VYFNEEDVSVIPLEELEWLSSSPCITYETVKKNPELEWSYDGLSGNPNITLEDVKNNIDKPWNYTWLSINPHITWEFVRDHQAKDWDYSYLSQNLFGKHPVVILLKRQNAAKVIQEKFLYWYYVPVCKDGTLGLSCKAFSSRLRDNKLTTA